MIPLGILAGVQRGSGGGGGEADPIAVSILAKLTSWWAMSEDDGTRADSHGTNHLSNIAGTVSTDVGLRGDDVAAAFSGAGALRAANSTSLQVPSGGGDHCIFGWAYFTSLSGIRTLVAKWDAASAASLEYAIDVESGSMYVLNGGSDYYYNPTAPTPPLNTWVFVVGWRDSEDGKVRLQLNNGTVYASASASNPAPTSNGLGFAQNGTDASGRFAGRLQLWGWIKGEILTSDERTWLYNSGSGRTYAEIVAAAI